MILGIHTTKSSKVLDDKTEAAEMSQAIERDLTALNLNAVQIFTHGPQSSRAAKLDHKDIIKTTSDIYLSVHSAYVLTGLWKAPNIFNDLLQKQLESCRKIKASDLVIHITKHPPEIIAKVMNLVKELVIKSKVRLILEMVANKAADDTYETPEKINYLTSLIGPAKWWGWCIDTAHLWGAGVDIQTYAAMNQWMTKIEHPNQIKMIHLNGSSAILGSGKDKHEIAAGPDDLIWHNIEYKKSGLYAIVKYATKKKIPMICEINRGKEAYVKKLIRTLFD